MQLTGDTVAHIAANKDAPIASGLQFSQVRRRQLAVVSTAESIVWPFDKAVDGATELENGDELCSGYS